MIDRRTFLKAAAAAPLLLPALASEPAAEVPINAVGIGDCSGNQPYPIDYFLGLRHCDPPYLIQIRILPRRGKLPEVEVWNLLTKKQMRWPDGDGRPSLFTGKIPQEVNRDGWRIYHDDQMLVRFRIQPVTYTLDLDYFGYWDKRLYPDDPWLLSIEETDISSSRHPAWYEVEPKRRLVRKTTA